MTLSAVAIVVVTALLGPPLAAPEASAPWRPPVTPLVVERPFDAPDGPYGRGHRGVDLAAAVGTVVRAPAPGRVRAAGSVAGKEVVSVEHPHRILGLTGWRTTYEGVRAAVAVGDVVAAGQMLGTVIVHAHGPGIHWGLKRGREYADPLLLLRRPIVLKPLGS